MNALKKYLGFVWMAAGPLLVAFMIWQAFEKIGVAKESDKANTILQWSIILLIFIPIAIGLMIFGWYATKGEYDHIDGETN